MTIPFIIYSMTSRTRRWIDEIARLYRIPREVFSRKQQEGEKKIAELEQRMMQYGDVKPATDADMGGKLENLRRLMG